MPAKPRRVMPTPPCAPQRPYAHTEQGVQRPDPFHWMRDREDPELLSYLEAENSYAQEHQGHNQDFRKTLYEEMLGLLFENW